MNSNTEFQEQIQSLKTQIDEMRADTDASANQFDDWVIVQNRRKSWTADDLETLPQREETRYELIDGELFVSHLPHRRHQQVGGRIFTALDEWSKESGLGEAILSPGIIPSDADNVIPDVVWVSKEGLAVLEDEAGHLTGFPELVVEVLSPGESNIHRDREAKLKLYSAQGVQEYWIADRFTQQIEVYRREQEQLVLMMTLMATDEVTSSLLPGFSCLVEKLF